MTNTILQKQHRTLWHSIPGLALSVVITGVALWGGSILAATGAGFSALILAILLGMILGDTIYSHIWKSCDGGVLFTKQYLLRLGIILYGFCLTLSQIAGVGIGGTIIDVLTLSSIFLLVCFLGRKVLGLDKHTSWLIGASGSIYGAAVVLAAESVVKAEANKVIVAIATVIVLGTITIFLYPAMHPLMSQRLSPGTFGICIGSIIHEVAQVVAAGCAISPGAENAAAISETLHVMILAPFLILLAVRVRRLSGADSDEKSKIAIPWFAILSVTVVTFDSFHLLPQNVVNILVTLDTFLLTMTMTALGLATHVSALKKAGAEPLLMALVLFAWLIVGSGAVNYVIQSIIA